MTVEEKLAETEAALTYAVARYWTRFDIDGPVWLLLGPLLAVLECLRDDGTPKPELSRDLPRYIGAARETMAKWEEWRRDREERPEVRPSVETWDRVQEELEGVRERWRGR